MLKPTIKINTELPEIGIPFDPIVMFFSRRVFISYEIPPSKGKFAILIFKHAIEFKITPINDEGIGSHKFAKYGLHWYSIHEITNIEETERWKYFNPIYWVFTFKDRTFEILAEPPIVLEKDCTIENVIQHLGSFSKIQNEHLENGAVSW